MGEGVRGREHLGGDSQGEPSAAARRMHRREHTADLSHWEAPQGPGGVRVAQSSAVKWRSRKMRDRLRRQTSHYHARGGGGGGLSPPLPWDTWRPGDIFGGHTRWGGGVAVGTWWGRGQGH